jgi:two-component system cell cycle response regulator
LTKDDDDWASTVVSIPGTPIESRQQVACLVVVRGNNIGESFPIHGPTMVIGRGSGSDLRINDEGVSRFHCKLHNLPDRIQIEDLGSRNGTYCNGERVVGMRTLVEGDRLQIGTTVVFRCTHVETTGEVTAATASEMCDPVTGALGRRPFVDLLEQEVGKAIAQNSPLSLVLTHIDRFAEITADHGAQVLDGIALKIVSYVHDNLRAGHALARLGEGDFAVKLQRGSPGDTFMFAERLRKHMYVPGTPDVASVQSVSLGVAAIHDLRIETAHDLMIAAGSALHRARLNGGNRTVLCTPDLIREPKSQVIV